MQRGENKDLNEESDFIFDVEEFCPHRTPTLTTPSNHTARRLNKRRMTKNIPRQRAKGKKRMTPFTTPEEVKSFPMDCSSSTSTKVMDLEEEVKLNSESSNTSIDKNGIESERRGKNGKNPKLDNITIEDESPVSRNGLRKRRRNKDVKQETDVQSDSPKKRKKTFLPQKNDVIGGRLSKAMTANPGNKFYWELISQFENSGEHATQRVIDGIRNQIPPGRFWNKLNTELLTEEEIFKKIKLAFSQRRYNEKRNIGWENESDSFEQSVEVASIHEENSEGMVLKEGDHDKVMIKDKVSNILIEEKIISPQIGTPHDNDVKGGSNNNNHPGNQLYNQLLRKYRDKLKAEVRIVNQIRNQVPSGKFWNFDNTRIITEQESYRKVKDALYRMRQENEIDLNNQKNEQEIKMNDQKDEHEIDVKNQMDAHGNILKNQKYENELTFCRDNTRDQNMIGYDVPFNNRDCPGTKLFNFLTGKYALDYNVHDDTIVDKIIIEIQQQNPPGRFMDRSNTGELDRAEIRRKISRALISKRNVLISQEAYDSPAEIGKDDTAQIRIAKKVEKKERKCKNRNISKTTPIKPENSDVSLTKKYSLPDVEKNFYVEDVAWRVWNGTIAKEDTDLENLPPPPPLPKLPDAETCIWTVDIRNRIIRGKLKPNVHHFSRKEEIFLSEMMERDDITIITEGHCKNLDADRWNLECINAKAGDRYHHRFRHFQRIQSIVQDSEISSSSAKRYEYQEIDKDLTMQVGTYISYLKKRRETLEMDKTQQDEHRTFTYENDKGEENSLDVLDDILYMLDYDIQKNLFHLYDDFREKFAFPQVLPGGSLCAMNAVNESARPDMGPNLYITPPGSFTSFHQDGYGTVDSGHLCLSGYNEVVMFRRLPQGYDIDAIDAKSDKFYEMPHAIAQGTRTADWPTKDQIEICRDKNYTVAIFVLGPNELVHIGKGRFHAFRKLGPETLPKDDCHFDLRNKIHADLKRKNINIAQLNNVSLAWDWSYLGVTPDGINREMTWTLENALRNRFREQPKQSLAIPKLCLLTNAETAMSQLTERNKEPLLGIITSTDNTERIERNRNILKGLLPTLEVVAGSEQEAYQNARTTEEPRPNSWENSAIFPLDPFGNSDYLCKICHQELANTYMHCTGCELILKKDFNICTDCHSAGKYRGLYSMHDKYGSTMDSSVNHTGCLPVKRSNKACCHVFCLECEKCCKCSCTCHSNFTLHQRMWTNEKLLNIVDKSKQVIGNSKIKYFDEVAPRLKETVIDAQRNKVKEPIRRTPKVARPKDPKRVTNIESTPLEPYVHCEKQVPPEDHLDISPEALAYTAPQELKSLELPGGSCTFGNNTPNEIEDFLSNGKYAEISTSQDSMIIQLYRNFIDEEAIKFKKSKNGPVCFSRREIDIIACAVLKGRRREPVPDKPKYSKSIVNPYLRDWGVIVWKLMPYRDRKSLTDKFYLRTNVKSNLTDKYEASLNDDTYREYLESRISPLFESVTT